MPSQNSFEDSMAQLCMAFRVEMKFGVIQTRVCLIQYVCAVCVVRTIPFILFPRTCVIFGTREERQICWSIIPRRLPACRNGYEYLSSR